MKAIVAMSESRVIGNNGEIPWHIKEDLQWFKEFTMNQTLVVGKNTFYSLPNLKDRTVYFISRWKSAHKDEIPTGDYGFYANKNGLIGKRLCSHYDVTNGITFTDILSTVPQDVYEKYGKNSKEVKSYIKETKWCIRDKCIIAGGAKIYEAFMPYITEFYVTHIKGQYEGDTYMPSFEELFEKEEIIKEFDGHFVVKYSNRCENTN